MKKSVLFAGLFAAFCFVLGGCENFGDAGFKDKLDNSINLAKAPKQSFAVAPLDVFDGNVTSSYSSAKIGEEFELSFTPDKNVYFVNWIAVDGENNIIKQPDINIVSSFANRTKAVVKINKEFENLRFIPYCIKRTDSYIENEPTFKLNAPKFKNSEVAGNSILNDDSSITFAVDRKYELNEIILNYSSFANKLSDSTEKNQFSYECNCANLESEFGIELVNTGTDDNNTYYKLKVISKIVLMNMEIQINCLPLAECGIDDDSGVKVSLTVAHKGDKNNLVKAPRYNDFKLDGYTYGTGDLPSVMQTIYPFSGSEYKVNNYAPWQSQNESWNLMFTFETDEELIDGDSIQIKQQVFYLPKGVFLNNDEITSFISSKNAGNSSEVGEEGLQIYSYDGNHLIVNNCDGIGYVTQSKNEPDYYRGYTVNYYVKAKVGSTDESWIKKEPELKNGKHVYNFYQNVELHHPNNFIFGGVQQFLVTFTHNQRTYHEVFFIELDNIDYTKNFGCESYNVQKLVSLYPKELTSNTKASSRISKNTVRVYRRPTTEDLVSYDDGITWQIKSSADGTAVYNNECRLVVKINDEIFVKNCADGVVGTPGDNSNPLLFYYDFINLNLPKEVDSHIEVRYVDSYFNSNYMCPEYDDSGNVTDYYDYSFKDDIQIPSSTVGNIVMINPNTGYVFDLDPAAYIRYDGSAKPIAVVASSGGNSIKAIGLKNISVWWSLINCRPFTFSGASTGDGWMKVFFYYGGTAEQRKAKLGYAQLKELIGYGPKYAYFKVPSDYCTVEDDSITLGENIAGDKYMSNEFAWFEPTLSEFRNFAENKAAINETLEMLGADKLEGTYWTSYDRYYTDIDASTMTQTYQSTTVNHNLRPTYDFYYALTGKDDIIDGVMH